MSVGVTAILLPAPSAYEWDWQLQARCRGADSAVFFSPHGERGHARTQRVKKAKEVCAECPVLETCRSYAIGAGEPYGVWGGLDSAERAQTTEAIRWR
jgi:WhiB family redox-sensing transcriptional regulator